MLAFAETEPKLNLKSKNYKALLLVVSTFLPSCGGLAPSPTQISLPTEQETACQPGVAEILVGDGYLQNLCGCVGPGESKTVYPVGQKLTCHLSTDNSYLYFYFLTTKIDHQIVSSGVQSFNSGPLIRAIDPKVQRVFVTQLPVKNTTYSFYDAIMPGLTGEVIVP